MADMSIERKEDAGLVYWLKDQFTSIPSVTVVDGFPDNTDLIVPSVSLEPDTVDYIPRQLGDRSGSRMRIWYFDVFAINKPQRNELAYKIYNDLEDGVTIYEIVAGAKTATKIGHLNILNKKIKMVSVDSTLVSKMYYRARISILAENDIL
jgi:hypothetical protein